MSLLIWLCYKDHFDNFLFNLTKTENQPILIIALFFVLQQKKSKEAKNVASANCALALNLYLWVVFGYS